MGVAARLSSPKPVEDSHDLDSFECGVPSLDDWLKRRARINQDRGATRTFVVAESQRVIAYYALASGGITAAVTVGRMKRNMPDPIPVVILGRLAIDRGWHGRGIGRALVRDAALRTRQAASAIGIRGLVVHAISKEARSFYLALGFSPSPSDDMTLMVTLHDIVAALAPAAEGQ